MNIRQKKSVIFFSLLVWLIVGCVKLTRRLQRNCTTYQIDSSKSDFDLILEFLSQLNINLILIDPFLLDYLFIRRLSFKQIPRRLITFGIFNHSIPILSSRANLSITVSQTSSIDHLFLQSHEQIVHLAVLHRESSYLLIRKNTASLPDDIQLSFGDTIRAIEPIETESLKNKYFFSIPRNLSHYLWLYNTSELLACNRTLADRMENEYHLYQNASQVNLILLPIRTIVMGLNQLEKRYWLAGGTLLGWYRHCGLIPYTQDVDLGLFAEEYDETIRDYFLGNPVVYLWGALGLVNDSLEFRLFTGRYTFDLFWAYREDDYRWCGYQIKRMKYKRILPLLPKLCSCDLFGYLFSIPCSLTHYLNNEYGLDAWQEPSERNYSWVNLKYDSIWDERLWLDAVHLYTSEGKLRRDKFAIDWIADQMNNSFITTRIRP